MCTTNSCYIRRLQHQRDQSNKIILKYRPSTNQPPNIKKNGERGEQNLNLIKFMQQLLLLIK